MTTWPHTQRRRLLRRQAWLPLIFLLVGGTALGAWQFDSPATRAAAGTPTTLQGCAAHVEAQRRACYERVLRLQMRRDVAATFARVGAHARASRWFATRCHMMMHPLGREFHASVAQAQVTHAGKDCVAGFLHGFLEERLGHEGALQPALVRRTCAASATPLQLADCEHGMGHVLMRNLANDLPGALERCGALARMVTPRRERAFQLNCAGGSLMENRFAARGADDAAPTRFADRRDPLRPCRALTVVLQPTCAAWAVRDVRPPLRHALCRRTAAHARAHCEFARGALERPASPRCAAEVECWRGYGYAVAMLPGEPVGDSVRRCVTARAEEHRAACAWGVGFRLSAAGSRHAALTACRSFERTLRDACRVGTTARRQPIDFA